MKALKILGSGFLAVAVLVASFALTVEAAVPNWNATGNYVVNMEYLGGSNLHNMNLVQNGVGALSGSGGSPVGANTYTWVITSGAVSGNIIDFFANYTATVDAVVPQTVLHVSGVIAENGTISGTWSDNYQGGSRTGALTTATGTAVALGNLMAEDFGVVNYDTGLGMLKGYTAGFGIASTTFAGAQSVVVKLYSSTTLLQTNTAILSKFNADVTGTQFSSPFDVSGTFNYVADGYWTNVREAQYGQSMPATRVVATVELANGKIVTATNLNLTGDPTTIYPPAPVNNMLTVNKAGTGSGFASSTPAGITCGADCSQSYASGTVVTLTASSTAGSTFSGWSVACSGTGSCVVTMGVAKSVTATFTLNVTLPPTGDTPQDKDDCKKGGWRDFTNPSFKNQGQCVSYTNHLDNDKDKSWKNDVEKKSKSKNNNDDDN